MHPRTPTATAPAAQRNSSGSLPCHTPPQRPCVPRTVCLRPEAAGASPASPFLLRQLREQSVSGSSCSGMCASCSLASASCASSPCAAAVSMPSHPAPAPSRQAAARRAGDALSWVAAWGRLAEAQGCAVPAPFGGSWAAVFPHHIQELATVLPPSRQAAAGPITQRARFSCCASSRGGHSALLFLVPLATASKQPHLAPDRSHPFACPLLAGLGPACHLASVAAAALQAWRAPARSANAPDTPLAPPALAHSLPQQHQQQPASPWCFRTAVSLFTIATSAPEFSHSASPASCHFFLPPFLPTQSACRHVGSCCRRF